MMSSKPLYCAALHNNISHNSFFLQRDDVKVFDFGLAKELYDDQKKEDGLYNLTAMTGSPRYMAPGKC